MYGQTLICDFKPLEVKPGEMVAIIDQLSRENNSD